MNDIYELADELANEIEESGKTTWSAKDVKDFFLSEGINLSLDEILQVWDACPSPVCASKLLGCNDPVFASREYTPQQRQKDMDDALFPIFDNLMDQWGETIGDLEDITNLMETSLDRWAKASDDFPEYL